MTSLSSSCSFWRSHLARALGGGMVAAVVACGSIADPTRGEPVATITGALVGTDVPANAHVALVWKVGGTGSWEVGADVAVTGGQFSMNLGAPPAGYFLDEVDINPVLGPDAGVGGWGSASDAGAPDLSIDAEAPDPEPANDAGAPEWSSSSGSSGNGMFDFGRGITPQDTISGSITKPLRVALAGFVVYVDKNGNGKLDLDGDDLKSADEIVGGNHEMLLAYFADGGSLDYEKLRDRSGVRPDAGYNLRWSDGERWLPLDAVELKIAASTRLPLAVCDRGSEASEAPPSLPDAGPPNGPDAIYPAPNDPNLYCSADGSSFVYYPPCDALQEGTLGLCGLYYAGSSCPGAYAEELVPGMGVPEGWPCPVLVVEHDAGVDAGPFGGDAGP